MLVTQAQVRARIKLWTDSTSDPVLADPADIDVLVEMASRVDNYGNIPDQTQEWVAGATHAVGDYVVSVAKAGDAFIPIVRNGFQYQATAITTGVSGNAEPNWPLVIGGTVVDGGVTWTAVAVSSWNPTYDVNYAIAQGWLLKSTRLVGHYNFMANGKMLSREQFYDHCVAMYKRFSNKSGIKGIRMGQHDPLAQTIANGGGVPTNAD